MPHITFYIKVYWGGPVFHGSHFGKSPEEAGGLGQSPLMERLSEFREEGLLSAGSERKVGTEWG